MNAFIRTRSALAATVAAALLGAGAAATLPTALTSAPASQPSGTSSAGENVLEAGWMSGRFGDACRPADAQQTGRYTCACPVERSRSDGGASPAPALPTPRTSGDRGLPVPASGSCRTSACADRGCRATSRTSGVRAPRLHPDPPGRRLQGTAPERQHPADRLARPPRRWCRPAGLVRRRSLPPKARRPHRDGGLAMSGARLAISRAARQRPRSSAECPPRYR
jgi:hypothetical protein